MPTVHVMAAVLAVRLMTAMSAVRLVFAVLVAAVTTFGPTVVSVCAMPTGVACTMLAVPSVIIVCVGPRMFRGRAAFGVRSVSTAVIVRFVRGVVGDAGVRGVGVLEVTASILVRTMVLMSTVAIVVALDTMGRMPAVGFLAVVTAAVAARRRIRKPATCKFDQPAIEHGGDLLHIPDLNPCLGCRNAAPDVGDPVAPLGARVTHDRE